MPGTEPGILAKGGQHCGLDEEQEEAQVPAPEAPYVTVLTKNVIGVIGVICD